MADISAKDVAALRKITGAGMMDCKKALEETDGDIEAAKDWLREKGIAGAAKREGRDADRRRDRSARRGQRRRARRAQLRDRLRRQGRRVQARGHAHPDRARRRRRRPRPKTRRRDGRRLREGPSGLAGREHPARARRPLRDGRRPARRVQARAERARRRRRARRARRRRPGERAGPRGRARHRVAHRQRGAALGHPRRGPGRRDRPRAQRSSRPRPREEGKPEQAWPKIIEGKLNGFYKTGGARRAVVRQGPEVDHRRSSPGSAAMPPFGASRASRSAKTEALPPAPTRGAADVREQVPTSGAQALG